jgi:hypothetical protein
MSDFLLRLKPEDMADIDDADRLNQPANEDVISAMTEAQLLEVVGKLGAAQRFILRTFEQPMSPSARRPLRLAYGSVNEAIRQAQALVDSTRRF